jgi:uncharacterized protein
MLPCQKIHSPRARRFVLAASFAMLLVAVSWGASLCFSFPPSLTIKDLTGAESRELVQGLPLDRSDSLPGRGPDIAIPKPEAERPRVVIVFDDMGYGRGAGELLLSLDLDLTFSFLPHAPHTPFLSHAAQRLGRDVLLHLPLEPIDSVTFDPGPGALFLTMSEEELRLQLASNLTRVPMAIGVNNHMGSRFTSDRQAMTTVLTMLRQHNLFFLDSMTSPDSTGLRTARELNIPAARRDIFIDNVREKEAIKQQFDALIRLARKKGTAIAIAHPHQATIEVLTEYQDLLRSAVQVVGLHSVVH